MIFFKALFQNRHSEGENDKQWRKVSPTRDHDFLFAAPSITASSSTRERKPLESVWWNLNVCRKCFEFGWRRRKFERKRKAVGEAASLRVLSGLEDRDWSEM